MQGRPPVGVGVPLRQVEQVDLGVGGQAEPLLERRDQFRLTRPRRERVARDAGAEEDDQRAPPGLFGWVAARVGEIAATRRTCHRTAQDSVDGSVAHTPIAVNAVSV